MLLLALSAAQAGEDVSGETKLGHFIPVTPPQPEPQVSVTDLAGKAVSLADFRGKPLVVNIWATWCQPCLAEMPSLDQLQGRMDGSMRVLAVSEDHAGAKKVQPFAARLKLAHLAIYLDPDGKLMEAFKVRGLPTSIVIDAQGRVVGKIEGGSDWNSPQIAAMLRPYLPKAKPSPKPVPPKG